MPPDTFLSTVYIKALDFPTMICFIYSITFYSEVNMLNRMEWKIKDHAATHLDPDAETMNQPTADGPKRLRVTKIINISMRY